MRSNPISVISRLVEICENGERGFRRAAEAVKDPHLATILLDYAAQREQFGSQLMYQVSRLGGRPEKHGTLAGGAHRRWIRVRAVLGADDAAILEECERGERCALRAYRNALKLKLPSQARDIAEQQQIQIEAAHKHISDMQARVLHETA